MDGIGRRSALALTATVGPAFASATPAAAATYGPDEGTEIGPGVRLVSLGKREAVIPGYKSLVLRDVVYQPGAGGGNPPRMMKNDMVCHCLEGELLIGQGSGTEFTAKKGDVWSCREGMPESAKNTGSTVAIMRVIDLLRA
jgi:hypothetical protein